MPEWIDVAAESDVAESGVLAVNANGEELALFKLSGAVFALIDRCSHGAARLSEGYIEGGCVECPLHQGLIDIRTGEPRAEPVAHPVQCFPTRIRDGRIEVEL
jgi:nitrite reductase/ring-hydroxylating ferredoxin subunit